MRQGKECFSIFFRGCNHYKSLHISSRKGTHFFSCISLLAKKRKIKIYPTI